MGQRSGECVYCGTIGPLTDDHVPPQSLCGKPRPADLLVVPSCKSCNSGASKDDEYFKTMMVMKETAGSHPEAEAVRDSVFRGLAMPRKRGFKDHVVRSMVELPVHSPGGLYLGRAPGFNVDLKRLDRVVERITKGLYWHHHGRVRLPNDHEVVVWSEEGLGGISIEEAANVREQLVNPCLANPAHSLGRGVLRYWHAPSDRTFVSGWLYEFFKDVRFVAFTIPADARRGA